MRLHHINLIPRKLREKLRSRKQYENELCKMLALIRKSEEEIIDLWRRMEALGSRRDNKRELFMKAIERQDKAFTDRLSLMKKVYRVEVKLAEALENRCKVMREYTAVRCRVKDLQQQHAATELTCESFWEMAYCLDDRQEERQEWRENLRRTRSLGTINDVVPRAPLVEAWQCDRSQLMGPCGFENAQLDHFEAALSKENITMSCVGDLELKAAEPLNP